MVTVALPTEVHEVPLVDSYAVNVSPLRTRRTQVLGAVPLLPVVVVLVPPVVVRFIAQNVPLPDKPMKAWREFAASDSRIITPILAPLPVSCSELTWAMISPSPLND